MLSCIITLVVASVSLFGYLIYVRKKLGYYPSTISQSYYDIPTNMRWSFLWALILSGGALITCGAILPTVGWSWPLLQLSGALIVLVAGASQFHTNGVGLFHYIGAIGGFLGGLLSFGLCYGMWWWSAIMAISAIVVVFKANEKARGWWVEVALSIGLILGMTTYMLMIG